MSVWRRDATIVRIKPASRRLVHRFEVMAVEDLSVHRLVHHHGLAQSLHDAVWSPCARFLSYKTLWDLILFVVVNPA